jgi:hypothetical protein
MNRTRHLSHIAGEFVQSQKSKGWETVAFCREKARKCTEYTHIPSDDMVWICQRSASILLGRQEKPGEGCSASRMQLDYAAIRYRSILDRSGIGKTVKGHAKKERKCACSFPVESVH